MDEMERKIMKFLVDGKAYSDTAIMKNFGIDYEQLQQIYKNLETEGYLETYAIYQTREENVTSGGNGCGGCSSGGCGGCSGGGCSGGGCSSGEDPLGDFTEVWVLTDKAIRDFS
jgi:uncharacterized membrane protein YgcG